jgi:hypothetical protein
MLLAGIFPAKQTQQEVMECSKIASSIIRTHKKTPTEPITFFLLGSSKKNSNFYGDVTLVMLPLTGRTWNTMYFYVFFLCFFF